MTVVQDIVTESIIGVRAVDTPEQLSAIRHPGCAAAIWQRQPLAGFQAWLDGLDADCLPMGQMVLPSGTVRNEVLQICKICGTPDCPERAVLIDDIAGLADIFAGLMDTRWLRLRLDVVNTNACRRFHIDSVIARLICTYRGLGTQYGISTDGTEPRQIFTAPTGAPILLRGKLSPECQQSNFRHRSPPIEGTGQTRLVLVLDVVDGPED